eukprot:scaffold190398_cov16-Tisochrysis_lutea.AAC.2
MEDCCSWCCMSLSSKPVADGHPAFVPWPMLLCCYTQEVIGTTYKNIGCIRNLPLGLTCTNLNLKRLARRTTT